MFVLVNATMSVLLRGNGIYNIGTGSTNDRIKNEGGGGEELVKPLSHILLC